MPQSRNGAAIRRRRSSPRSASTRAQLVPPAPATSRMTMPASISRRPTAVDSPAPTSLTPSGTGSARASASIRASRSPKSRSPPGWIASCSGFRCSISASASSMSTARRASSMPMPRFSCTAPRLPRIGTRGARARNSRPSPPAPRPSIAMRCEPTASASPSDAQASAMLRLIPSASPVPPVIADTISGAESLCPRNRVDMSIAS